MLTPSHIPSLPKRPIVVHNDLDGLLSWLFLREKGYELVGLYDLTTLYLKKSVLPKDILAVDLDINHPSIPSVGHHFSVFHAPSQVNMNHLFDVTDPNRQFTSKCPLPTFLFLHWLTQTPLPVHLSRQALLVYADGLHLSHGLYRNNVTNWLNALGYSKLLGNLERGLFLPYIENIAKLAGEHGFRPSKQSIEKKSSKAFPQCTFQPHQFPSLLPLVQALAETLGYKPVHTLPKLEPILTGHRYTFDYNQDVHLALQQKHDEWHLLSHGLTSKTRIQATLLTEISEQHDPILTQHLIHAF